MKVIVKTKNQKETEKFESIWSEYVNALAVLDTRIKGANARMARARLGKAEKKLSSLYPDFYRKVVLKQS